MTNGRVLALCVVAAAASGCHGDSGQSTDAKATGQTRLVSSSHGPTAQEQTANMVEAATLGRSQAPVGLKFELVQRPSVGQVLDISIAVLPEVSGGPANLQVTAADGLTLSPGFGALVMPTVEASQVYRHHIRVTPTTDGLLFLGLTVTLNHDDVVDSRVFSVPLIVALPAGSADSPK